MILSSETLRTSLLGDGTSVPGTVPCVRAARALVPALKVLLSDQLSGSSLGGSLESVLGQERTHQGPSPTTRRDAAATPQGRVLFSESSGFVFLFVFRNMMSRS